MPPEPWKIVLHRPVPINPSELTNLSWRCDELLSVIVCLGAMIQLPPVIVNCLGAMTYLQSVIVMSWCCDMSSASHSLSWCYEMSSVSHSLSWCYDISSVSHSLSWSYDIYLHSVFNWSRCYDTVSVGLICFGARGVV